MALLTPDPTSTDEQHELELLIREARRRQRRRRLAAVILVLAAVGGAYVVTRTAGVAERAGSLLSRPLHLPSLQPGQPCPASSGYRVANPYFDGIALGRGPVRVLFAGGPGVSIHGRVEGAAWRGRSWHAIVTLWFAMPRYQGSFVVRGAKLGTRGPMEVQPDATGLVPGSGPLVVPAGGTANTFYTGWRPGHVRDPVTGRLVRTLTGYGYRTWPGSTWVKEPGCYAWQVDGRGFSDVIVLNVAADNWRLL